MVFTALSNQPDPKLLRQLVGIQQVGLGLLVAVAAVQGTGWLIPDLGESLARAGLRMTFGTTLCTVFATFALVFLEHRGAPRAFAWARLCAALTAILGLASAAAQLTGLPLDFALQSAPPWMGQAAAMSLHSALFFALFGGAQLVVTERAGRLGMAVDGLNFALLVLTIDSLAGAVFLAGPEDGSRLLAHASPAALLCFALTTLLSIIRRVECCLFSTLFGVGIGSRTARLVLPLSVATPFLFVVGHVYLETEGLLAPPLAATLTATVSSVFFFALVLAAARVINGLERELRELSLTDELTGLLNGRGFELLGGQAMRAAQRNRQALTVFFFDLDGLKQVNDCYGHDVGSQLIVDLANLLRSTFRGADIPARVGGDEFAVVFHDSGTDTESALRRLERATGEANAAWGRPYRISYSVGHATAAPGETMTIGQLVNRADAQMYVFKRDKAAERAHLAANTTG